MKFYLGLSAFILLAMGALWGCGSNSNNSGAVPTTCPANYTLVNGTCVAATGSLAYQGNCPGGYIQTQYGCEPQGSCPVGQGYYNGTCVGSVATGAVGSLSCQGSCPTGYVQTNMGCEVQGNCAPCMGSYNGTCVPGVTGTAGYPYGTPGYPGTTPYGTTTAGYPYGYGSGYPYGTIYPAGSTPYGYSGYGPFGYPAYGGAYPSYGYGGFYGGMHLW